jgi:hypothetical protein
MIETNKARAVRCIAQGTALSASDVSHLKDAADLIDRQQAEVARLKQEHQTIRQQIETVRREMVEVVSAARRQAHWQPDEGVEALRYRLACIGARMAQHGAADPRLAPYTVDEVAMG